MNVDFADRFADAVTYMHTCASIDKQNGYMFLSMSVCVCANACAHAHTRQVCVCSCARGRVHASVCACEISGGGELSLSPHKLKIQLAETMQAHRKKNAIVGALWAPCVRLVGALWGKRAETMHGHQDASKHKMRAIENVF